MGLLGYIADAASSVGSTLSDAYEGATDVASGVVDTVVETGSDVYGTVSDVAGGAVDTVADTAGDLYTGASEGLGEVADFAGEKWDSVVDAGSGALDAAGDLASSIDPEAALHYAVKGAKGLGGAANAFGGKLAPYMGPLASLGKVAGPLAVVDGVWNLVDEFQASADPAEGQSSRDTDWNNVITNGVNVGAGALTTLGSLGIGGGTAMAGGSAAAGGAAAAGGSVLGSLAAGLLAGHYTAKFADSDYGRDENGKTSYDYNTEAAHGTEQWVNNALGLEEGSTAGMIAGGAHAALGGIGAGLVGGGQALGNFIGGLF